MFKSVLLSLIVHVGALAALIFSFDWNIDEEPEPVNIVHATAVDESKIAKQIKNLKKIEAQKKHQEDRRLAKLAKEAQRARRDRERQQQQLEKLKQKRQADAKQLADLKSKQKKEKQHQQEIAKQRAAENQRLARIRADKEREAKKLKQQREKQRQNQEMEYLEEQMQAEEEERLTALLAAEKTLVVQDPNAEAIASKRAEYIARLQQLVQRNWRKPPALANTKDLKCQVYVRLMPTGEVLIVKIAKSSGNTQFDRSVETAVRKSAPFPIPKDKEVFDGARELNFVFNPPETT